MNAQSAKLSHRLDFPFDTPPKQGELVEVAAGVFWTRMDLPMALDHVNIYIFDDGDGPDGGWTIIDTGFGARKTREAWEALIEGPLQGRRINRIIATHQHPDHLGLAGWFVEKYGAELIATRTTFLYARMLQLDHHDETPKANIDHWRRAGASAEMLEIYKARRPFNFSTSVAPLPAGYTRIAAGDMIRFGQRNWHVRIGNGHAPEHATFWSIDDNLVVTGDQIIPGISSNLGVYPVEPEADPVGDWLESCTALMPYADAGQLALPGHKLPFTGIPLRLEQLIRSHFNALDRLRPHLSEWRSAGDCFSQLFKRNIGESEYGLALVEAQAHLNHLYRHGEVDRKDEDGVWSFRLKMG